MNDMSTICREKPRLMLVELTSKCNLKCDYCFKSRLNMPTAQITAETFGQIRGNLGDVENVLLCGMGEQFLHKEIYNFVEQLKDKRVYILTNGTIPIDYPRLTASGNVETLVFSIDGPTEAVIKKSCVSYNFKALVRNLEEGARYRELMKDVNYVMGESNLAHTAEMLDFLRPYGFHSINLLLPTYAMKWVKKNRGAIDDMVARCEEKSSETGIHVVGPFAPKCTFNGAPVGSVDCRGNYRPCCDPTLRAHRVGNIASLPFDTLWDDAGYEKFRSGKYCVSCVYNDPIFRGDTQRTHKQGETNDETN